MPSRKAYRYRVVDVFTTEPLQGNPLAVFPDAAGLSSEQMQSITRELNLSETVFFLPSTRPDCAARLRIFTPGKEMDFAGHPTVGSGFILLDEKIVPPGTASFMVEENVGPVPVTVDPGPMPRVWLTTPPLKEEAIVERSTAAALVGLKPEDLLDYPPQILNAGNPTLFIPVGTPELVDRMCFNGQIWARVKAENHPGPMCLMAFAPVAEGAYSRMFAPDYGIIEDPATGSSTGSLASYMMKHRLISSEAGTRFYSEQGVKMGRRSILHVKINGSGGAEGIAVGGNVTPIIEATMTL